MYDLHAHILPEIDDGAKNPEDTVEMARIAAKDGTKVMLATPHRKDVTERSSVSYVKEILDDMNQRIQEENIGLSLVLGMENHLDLDLPDEVSRGRALPMNETRYILVEAPFFGRPNYMEDVLFQLQIMGLVPVLAHPERIEAFQKDPRFLSNLIGRGMLSQITSGSIVGHFGRRVRRISNEFLRRGMVHVIASDTHFPKGPRSPILCPGIEAAANIIGVEKAQQMVQVTPKAILEDIPVQVELPKDSVRSNRKWFFWRRG